MSPPSAFLAFIRLYRIPIHNNKIPVNTIYNNFVIDLDSTNESGSATKEGDSAVL